MQFVSAQILAASSQCSGQRQYIIKDAAGAIKAALAFL